MPELTDLLPITLDMTRALTAEDRSQRLVDAVVRALPCDAVVLLRLEEDELVPAAAHGLSPDLLGRRFRRAEHPRLDVICSHAAPTLFPADSQLPDPFDGLVGGEPHLDVHSCLGCPLLVDGELVGVLTADALQAGAFDAVEREFLVHLAALAAAALHTGMLIDALEQRAHQQGLVTRDLVDEAAARRGGLLIGEGQAMSALRAELELVAASDLPVLVVGETGTGKELVVRTLHARSGRAERPLVYVNCAALPEAVVESELFGHVRGAFTGAEGARPGKFRIADGASLFLDEIGELPLHVQPKLLRFLQEGEIQPVGADTVDTVDVRIVAATNRDLEQEVRAGRFRADLLHRLDGFRLRVPALAERREDIPRLVGHFADRARRQLGTGPIRLGLEAHAQLTERAWPGNVRELEHEVARAVLRASARVTPGEPVVIEACDLRGGAVATEPAPTTQDQAARGAGPATPDAEAAEPGTPLRERVRAFQRRAVTDALAAADGSYAAAARSLGMHRSNLHHLAKRLGLR